ncbi:helix-turn-helix transcriptional regulator [Chryseobacterium sp. CBo1]|uniref:response regulator transcription factor n=1 Tax=Chryseobacterium sp. CBo1 TaxID=1869230 RepID=UPI0008106F9F|nr:LuxR C-terminal-related transcriptional regulator [Chryseobacterium sp. CBo1]OCK50609.1 helix-turn-helix transcriptional regulator [Chryseobacterium sp. CBo1]
MEKSEEKHPLIDVWNSYRALQKNGNAILEKPPIEQIVGEMFGIGNYYYYVLNLSDSTLTGHNKNILNLHGFKKFPEHLKQIIDLIHPDDISFVLNAERIVIEKIIEIGKEFQLYLKPSYCFRMKTTKGNYELFHHQAIHTMEDHEGNLIQSINIHTNIQHITKENPYTVLLTGISPRTDFIQIKADPSSSSYFSTENDLTKRETEVLSLIAKGYSGKEISVMLILSEHTVRTHRRNILHKTQCRNSKELVKKAFDLGLI